MIKNNNVDNRKRLTSTPNAPDPPSVFASPPRHHHHAYQHARHKQHRTSSSAYPYHTNAKHRASNHHTHSSHTGRAHHQQQSNRLPNHQRHSTSDFRDSVLILGDSIANKLDSNRLTKSVEMPVTLEHHATLDSTIKRLSKGVDSDVKKLVIFTGTNNMKLEPASVTTEKLFRLEHSLTSSKHMPSKVVFHGILPRSDVDMPPHKRSLINNAIEDICYRNKWHFISPEYFHLDLLDKGGLHPAGRGKGAIASALISSIGRGSFPRSPMMAVREDPYE